MRRKELRTAAKRRRKAKLNTTFKTRRQSSKKRG
jgi:hypothetical protein